MAAVYLSIAKYSAWRGEGDFFLILQTSAALLSFVVGLIAFLRYSTKKNTTLLFIAVGFLGSATLDILHIIFISNLSSSDLPSSPQALYAWGWTVSRLFLSIMLFLSWLAWWLEGRWKQKGQVSEAVVYAVTILLLFATFVFFRFVQLPEAYYPSRLIPRPWELFSAIFFAAALMGYLGKGEWKRKNFDHWINLMLVVFVFSQILVSTVSFDLFDSVFYSAYLAKNLGYWFMLTGLLMSVSTLFNRVVKTEDFLTGQNVLLTEAKVDLQQALQATRTKERELAKKIEELQRARAKDTALLDNIGDGLVVTDDDTKIIKVNQGFHALLGYESEEVHGKPVTMILQPEDESGKSVPYEKRAHPVALFTGEKVSETMKNYYKRKDGSRFPVSVTVTPVTMGGKTIGAVEIFRDVTQEKNIDRSKTEFVSLASHQLRTPLTSINWYSEMILNGDAGELTNSMRLYVEEISIGTQRMSKLVGSLLNVSRIDLGAFGIDPQEADVIALADDVLRELEPQRKDKKLKVIRQYAKDLPKISVDTNLMRIIFQNLLTNAMKYTPEKGKITVKIGHDERYLNISIADTGYGIPLQQQGRIFQKLFRADNVRAMETDGTGLGLYMVRSILDEAGGKVWFESEVEKGSTFFVRLPLTGMRAKEGSKDLAASTDN